MTYIQRAYKALRRTTILSKAECRKLAIKAAARLEALTDNK